MLQKGEAAESADFITPEQALKDPFVLEFLNLKGGPCCRPPVLDQFPRAAFEAAVRWGYDPFARSYLCHRPRRI